MAETRPDRIQETSLLETEQVGSVLLWTLFGMISLLAVFALTAPLWGWP